MFKRSLYNLSVAMYLVKPQKHLSTKILHKSQKFNF